MADATLIQGARELAAAKSGINAGAAFGAGYEKAMARNQKEMALLLKQQKESERAAEAALKESEKYMREYAIKGVHSVVKGKSNGLTPEDLQHATAYLSELRANVIKGENLLAQGYRLNDRDLIRQSRTIGEGAKGGALSFYNQLSLLQEARANYATIKNTKTIATTAGNSQNIKDANVLMSSDWSVKNGEIVFSNGTKLADITLPYTTEIGNGFIEWAGSETEKVSRMTKSELNLATTKKEQIENTAREYLSGEEGINRLEVLLSQKYFTSLNSGFSNIILDRENPEIAIEQAVQATVNAIYGVAKADKIDGTKKGAAIRPELQGSYKEMKDLQDQVMSAPITPGVTEAPEFTGGAKTWSVGPKDNPSKIRIKLDPQKRKWVYFDAGSNVRAEYDSIEELTKAYPSLFFK